MGIYYHFAAVHSRVLIWWTDNDGQQHEKWIEGPNAESFLTLADKADMTMQKAMRELAA